MVNRRELMQSAAALAVLPWGVGAMAAEPAGAPLPALGSALVVPSLTLLDGSPWGPAQAEGKVLVVYWWASWCPFCAVQSPHMEALWQAGRSEGLVVLGLSIDRLASTASAHLKAKGYSFPAAMATPEVAKVWPKPRGLPVVVVRGRNGRVVFAEAREMVPEDIENLKKYL
jgi:thiol-disulfide isomerase/thioredoxin